MVVVMYAAVELLLFAAISIKFGRMFTFSGFEAQRREVNAGDDPFGMGDVSARLRLKAVWAVVGPFERLVGAEPLALAARRAEG